MQKWRPAPSARRVISMPRSPGQKRYAWENFASRLNNDGYWSWMLLSTVITGCPQHEATLLIHKPPASSKVITQRMKFVLISTKWKFYMDGTRGASIIQYGITPSISKRGRRGKGEGEGEGDGEEVLGALEPNVVLNICNNRDYGWRVYSSPRPTPQI